MTLKCKQQTLPFFESVEDARAGDLAGAVGGGDNSLRTEDSAFHTWYRFVLSYPPHLVRHYLRDFGLKEGATVLDPFCGVGTTLIEAKLNQLRSVGIEANPFPRFASAVKVNWRMDPYHLLAVASDIAASTYTSLAEQGIDDRALTCDPHVTLRTLSPKAARAIIKNSISPLPLHKTLVLLDELNRHRASDVHKYGMLALGNALVTTIGNLRFGPEVGVGRVKPDVPVVQTWLHEIRRMADDLSLVREQPYPEAIVHLADAREVARVLAPESIDAVMTSPPYPNEKDYTRTTRLESVVLGFFTDMSHLRTHKKRLLRSNTRGVYKHDDDDTWIANNQRIQRLAEAIEARRIELGKTSGFERLYARVTKLYFGGMARHLTQLTSVLKPGARLAYVVGDQASYLRVMIRTGQILAEIAQESGYQVDRIDLFRTRFATATRKELREEVVVLRWPGHRH